MGASGIEFGESIDEVIEGTPKIIANLTDERAESDARECFIGESDIYYAVRRPCIDIERDGISLFLKKSCDLPFKLTKVFICPLYSFTAAVKRVREIIDHD